MEPFAPLRAIWTPPYILLLVIVGQTVTHGRIFVSLRSISILDSAQMLHLGQERGDIEGKKCIKCVGKVISSCDLILR